MRPMKKATNGFTLVEMAVVVFLIGILATMGLSAANSLLASSSISDTKKKQEVIRDALIAYIATNKRLPCPAKDERGNEYHNAATPRICSGYFGVIPYQELGLQKSTATDGWGNMFSYAVSSQWSLAYSNSDSTTTSNNPAISFNTGDPGALLVKNRPDSADAATADIGTAAVIVISHGLNGLGAFTSKGTRNSYPADTTDEYKNIVPDTFAAPIAFYQREYTDVDVPIYGSFDDVLLTLSHQEIISKLIKDGAIKSPESEWSQQIENINNALASFMLKPNSLNCAPPINQSDFNDLLAANNINIIDPWGGSISYNRLIVLLDSDGKMTPNTAGSPYSLSTTTVNKPIRVPTAPVFYDKYKDIIKNNC